MKKIYVATILFFTIILLFIIYDLFVSVTVQDINAPSIITRGNSSNVSFTIVNNMFYERHFTYTWELDDSMAMKPSSKNLTGSGNISIPAFSSRRITVYVPSPDKPPSEGVYPTIKVFEGNICVTPHIDIY